MESLYDYTPETETIQSSTRTALIQTLDKIDLNAIIKAINGL